MQSLAARWAPLLGWCPEPQALPGGDDFCQLPGTLEWSPEPVVWDRLGFGGNRKIGITIQQNNHFCVPNNCFWCTIWVTYSHRDEAAEEPNGSSKALGAFYKPLEGSGPGLSRVLGLPPLPAPAPSALLLLQQRCLPGALPLAGAIPVFPMIPCPKPFAFYGQEQHVWSFPGCKIIRGPGPGPERSCWGPGSPGYLGGAEFMEP